MSFVGPCHFCGESVMSEMACHPVAGWEPLRKQGGANHIIARTRDKLVVAHKRCAERAAELERRGIHEGQGELL